MTNHEDNVRAAAKRLHAAVVAARQNGLSVAWPSRVDDLPAIAVSETGRPKVDVTVSADVDPSTAARASAAAQKAAEKVVDKA